MKVAIYFMRLCGAGLIALGGFVMFLYGLISDLGSTSNAFFGLAVMGAGAYLLAYVLENFKCPVKLCLVDGCKKEKKAEEVVEEAAPVEEAVEVAAETAEVFEEAAQEATEEATAEAKEEAVEAPAAE